MTWARSVLATTELYTLTEPLDAGMCEAGACDHDAAGIPETTPRAEPDAMAKADVGMPDAEPLPADANAAPEPRDAALAFSDVSTAPDPTDAVIDEAPDALAELDAAPTLTDASCPAPKDHRGGCACSLATSREAGMGRGPLSVLAAAALMLPLVGRRRRRA